MATYQSRNADEKPSYVHIQGTQPLLGVNLVHFVESQADRFGDRMAMIDRAQGIRKTFTQFQNDIYQLATGFLTLNWNRGDRIGIWSPNCYEWVVTQFASAITGLILVTLNPAYQPPEFDYCLQKMKMKAVVASRSFKTQDYYKMLVELVPEIAKSKTSHFHSEKYPYFDTVILLTEEILPGALRYCDVIKAGGTKERTLLKDVQKEMQIDDPAMILLTSGTTGNPKAATLTHFGLVNMCRAFIRRTRFNDGYHRVCVQVPLFHAFGCLAVNVCSVIAGLCAVFPSPAYKPEETLKSIAEEKCTVIYGTPTMFIDLLAHPDLDKTDFSSMNRGAIGGSICPSSVLQSVIDKMNCPGLVHLYGCTEICGATSLHDVQEPISNKIVNVGKPVEMTEVKIVDNQDRIVPLGVPGDICVRSPFMMTGYWEDEDSNRQVFKDRWYHSGDLGTMDEDGYLRIVGRIKDMIIRGGENIYPKEIEDHLNTHPGIFAAHVIPVSDDRMGEEVCAWIKLNNSHTMTQDDVTEFCRRKLAHFKIPRYTRFVDDFPKTPNGKVQKYIMREEMEAILHKNPK